MIMIIKIFVAAYTMHTRDDPRTRSSHNACAYTSTQLADVFDSCDV